MNNDNFTEAARAEAERRFPLPERKKRYDGTPEGVGQEGFEQGAEWARAHLAAQEPTDAEVEALARMTTEEVSGCDWASFGEDARNYHRDTARRRLTAARLDEKDRP